MTPEQIKRRDELADADAKMLRPQDSPLNMKQREFKAGYEAGFADAKEEILKLKTALGVAGEFIKRNDELTRNLELYDELVEALEQHVSGCGLGFHHEELLKRVKELE